VEVSAGPPVGAYIEESLYRSTQWVVFEPNDQQLWEQIRLNVTAFMPDLFRQGAFQGSTPHDAYFVRCDGVTTTQTNIDRRRTSEPSPSLRVELGRVATSLCLPGFARHRP